MVHCSCGPRGGMEGGGEEGGEGGRGSAARVSNSCEGREEGAKKETSVNYYLMPNIAQGGRAWSSRGREKGMYQALESLQHTAQGA